MTDETPSLILEHLRYLRARVDRIGDGVNELKERVGHLEGLYATLSVRTDKLDERLERIERRLDLVEVP